MALSAPMLRLLHSVPHRARVKPLHVNQIMSLSCSKPSQWLPIAFSIKSKLLSIAYKALHDLALVCISLASCWSTVPLSTALPLHCHLFFSWNMLNSRTFSLEVPLSGLPFHGLSTWLAHFILQRCIQSL